MWRLKSGMRNPDDRNTCYPEPGFDYDHLSVYLGLYDIGNQAGSPHVEVLAHSITLTRLLQTAHSKPTAPTASVRVWTTQRLHSELTIRC
jgi:hypothetical protein